MPDNRTSRTAYPNMHNLHPMSWPLTGPEAIAVKRPVVGTIVDGNGSEVSITQGETCLWRVGRPCFVWNENVVEGAR